MSGAEAFASHARPRVAAMLRAAGLDVAYERGAGPWLYYRDAAGREREVLDCVGGFGAGLLGHNHPALLERARSVLDAGRPMLAQGSVKPETGRLAQRLAALCGAGDGRDFVCTFASTGAEAVEAALKHAQLQATARDRELRASLGREQLALRRAGLAPDLVEALAAQLGMEPGADLEDLFAYSARALDAALGAPLQFVALRGGFHGKTGAAVQLTWRPAFREPFAGLGPRVLFLDPEERPERLPEQLATCAVPVPFLRLDPAGHPRWDHVPVTRVAAAFVEVIQGEGGVREVPVEFLRALRAAADAAGFPLVIDEIQTGMGRSGELLASQERGLRAEYYLLSKALGGGLAKISACLIDRACYLPEFGYLHSSTFAEDAFSTEIAHATLDLLEADDAALLRRCRNAGAEVRAGLEEVRGRHPGCLREVRGQGLMLAVELALPLRARTPLLEVCADQGWFGYFCAAWLLREWDIRVLPTLGEGCVLRLQPALTTPVHALRRLVAALDALCARLTSGAIDEVLKPLLGGSSRLAPARVPSPCLQPVARRAQAAPRVGFLCHFLDPGDLMRWDPSLTGLDPQHAEEFFARSKGLLEAFVVDRMLLCSDLHPGIEVCLIGLPFVPGLAARDLQRGEGAWLRDLLAQGMELARSEECQLLGFGGHTSILSRSCLDVAGGPLPVTSGNALTAGAALQAMRSEAARRGIAGRRLGIVGAQGNIGMVLAELGAADVDEVLLFGRGRDPRRLQRAATELRERIAARGLGTRVRCASDLHELKDCDLVLTASNAAEPLVGAAELGHGEKVVVDLALPRDVSDSVAAECPGVSLLRGGVVRTPAGQAVQIPGAALRPGEIFACLAETVLLGMDGVTEDFSVGPLLPAQVEHSLRLARQHGFEIDARPLQVSHSA